MHDQQKIYKCQRLASAIYQRHGVYVAVGTCFSYTQAGMVFTAHPGIYWTATVEPVKTYFTQRNGIGARQAPQDKTIKAVGLTTDQVILSFGLFLEAARKIEVV